MMFTHKAHHLLCMVLSGVSLFVAGDAFATCSFICEGTVVDASCNPITLSTPSHVPIWTDMDQQPLFLASCKVQCCAPGMCSDPQFEPILTENLRLLTPGGVDVMGEFLEDPALATMCGSPQAFVIQSALTAGITYDVVHTGQLLSRFFYDPVPTMVSGDMGADMDVDMSEEDMGPDSEDMPPPYDMGPDMDVSAPDMEDMEFVEYDYGVDHGYVDRDYGYVDRDYGYGDYDYGYHGGWDGGHSYWDAGYPYEPWDAGCCDDYEPRRGDGPLSCSSLDFGAAGHDELPALLLLGAMVGLLYRRRKR